MPKSHIKFSDSYDFEILGVSPRKNSEIFGVDMLNSEILGIFL